MTRSSFALAIRADEKWVENTSQILGLKLNYTREEALWMGLVRELVLNVGITLSRAKEVADEALGRNSDQKVLVGGDSAVGIEIDLKRYCSTFIASLSAARILGGVKRRGRARQKPRGKKGAIEAARRYGVDIDLLREGLKLSAAERLERLNQNAEFVTQLRHSTQSLSR